MQLFTQWNFQCRKSNKDFKKDRKISFLHLSYIATHHTTIHWSILAMQKSISRKSKFREEIISVWVNSVSLKNILYKSFRGFCFSHVMHILFCDGVLLNWAILEIKVAFISCYNLANCFISLGCFLLWVQNNGGRDFYF